MKQLTVHVELEGGESMRLITHVQKLCGTLMACRVISPRKFELTMADMKGKERLMEGFKAGETRVHAKEIANN